MDSTKTAIKSLVLDLRKTLEADIEVGLRRYGITPTLLRPLETLGHLDDRGKTARIRMEEAIRHEMERADDQKTALAQAVHWFVREVAFTHLNRLVGLKALEVRGLTPEIIQTRSEYGNRSRAQRDYRDAHPAAAALADDGLEGAIQAACLQIYPEFHLLFDVGDPQEMREAPVNSLLWPGTPTLKACIAKINELDANIGREGAPAYGKATPEQSIWAEDEIIGWVYQFYNAEEKISIRDKGKPTHPSEVAVINQFFSPRWVVKFLVDNTLGRLWLEMHPDSPRVRVKCDYLVPEPASTGGRDIDPDSPVNNPDAPARRAVKRPQDIRLIDPACGTMHFGHYAFEVFQAIYADAREQRWVKGADALDEAEVPAAILQNNLYGVDIDLRAIQLAALSLFMKAKSANPEARVGQVNLVVADAHLPHGKVREDFLAQYKGEPVIQQAFAEVFESLDNVAEVGSLLRVEERFQQSLEKAGHPSAGIPVQVKIDVYKGKMVPVHQTGFGDISATGWQPEYTVDQMLGHLREFARKALSEHDLNAQLFAAETEKSVALLDVFLHEYDVVVMNPPYGETTVFARKYLAQVYPITGFDLYAAFMERGLRMLKSKGYLGSLTSRTYLTLASFEKFRELLLKEFTPIAIADLGFGVLDDALVETCLSVIGSYKSTDDHQIVFYRRKAGDDKRPNLEEIRRVQLGPLRVIPGYQFAYRAPSTLLKIYTDATLRLVDKSRAKMGLGTGKDEVFIRYSWELGPHRNQDRWRSFSKGGDFSRYYFDFYWVIDWADNGEPMKEYTGSRLQGKDYYGKSGITWPWITVKGFNARFLDKGFLFANISPLLPIDTEGENKDFNAFSVLAFLNSSAVSAFLDLVTPSRNYTTGQVNALPLPQKNLDELTPLGKQAYELKKIWDEGNEVSTHFSTPWVIQITKNRLGLPGLDEISLPFDSDLKDRIDYVISIEHAADIRLQILQAEIDKIVYALYEITHDDQLLIEQELGERPQEIVWPYAERLSSQQKAAEHVARLMSYCLLAALHIDPDGILPLSESSGGATALRQVQSGLEKHFGESAAYQVENDAAVYLGRPLGEWLVKNFWKDFHVKWYKSRPILWQLQSQKGAFACLVHIHKMDRDTLPKLRTQYLWAARNACQAALESARLREDQDRSAAKEVARLEAMLDDLNDFDKRLSDVIEARVKCKFPDWAQGPYRNGIYDPVLDDGVAVNILPLQEAGLLAKAKVV